MSNRDTVLCYDKEPNTNFEVFTDARMDAEVCYFCNCAVSVPLFGNMYVQVYCIYLCIGLLGGRGYFPGICNSNTNPLQKSEKDQLSNVVFLAMFMPGNLLLAIRCLAQPEQRHRSLEWRGRVVSTPKLSSHRGYF